MSYALGGGMIAERAAALRPADRLRLLLFNTAFSEPEGFEHGGRAVPSEKLPWWMFRFDPAAQASPEVDLEQLNPRRRSSLPATHAERAAGRA